VIALTYDQVMKIGNLVCSQIDYYNDVYDGYDNSKNIVMIKGVMKSLSDTHIPSIEKMKQEISKIITGQKESPGRMSAMMRAGINATGCNCFGPIRIITNISDY